MKTAIIVVGVAVAAYVGYRLITGTNALRATAPGGTVASAGAYGNSVAAALGAK